MRVAVAGGRTYDDRSIVYATLDALSFGMDVADGRSIEAIVEGGAEGADTLARQWAISRGVTVCTFRAEWERHGKAAGPIRNREMLNVGEADVLVAFPGGSGTASAVSIAEELEIPVLKVKPMMDLVTWRIR